MESTLDAAIVRAEELSRLDLVFFLLCCNATWA